MALGFGEPFFRAAQDELDKRARLPFTSGFQVMPAALGPAAPLDRRGGAGQASRTAEPARPAAVRPGSTPALPAGNIRAMRPTYSAEAEAYREKVQAFLAEKLPADWGGIGALEGDELTDFVTEWRKTLYDAGYLAPGWPVEYGGGGLSALEQVIIAEEFAKAGVPTGGPNDVFGIQMLGNTLLQWGTDEQKDALPAADPVGRRHLVSGLLRAERRQRPLQPRPARPSSTATSGCSTARRSGRRPATSPTTSSRSPAPIPTRRGTRASRSSSSTCASRASRCARSR